MHGSFSRAETRNFMAAIGPDFKAHFSDPVPVGNTDIAPTLAKILKLKIAPGGQLSGRVVIEALRDGKSPQFTTRTVRGDAGADGLQTVLEEQIVGETRYFDAAGFPGRTVGLDLP